MDIDKIITESINKIIAEVCEVDNAPNGWHSWEETDAANGLTPEEAKNIPTNGSFGRPTYEEWKAKYPNMKYSEYCFKIYGVKLR